MTIERIKSGILPEQISGNQTQVSDRQPRGEGFARVLDGEIKEIPETEALKTISITMSAESGSITQPAFHVIDQLTRITVSGPSREDGQLVEAIAYMFEGRMPEFNNEQQKTDFALKTAEIKRWTGTI